jgi:hypothetical protein
MHISCLVIAFRLLFVSRLVTLEADTSVSFN